MAFINEFEMRLLRPAEAFEMIDCEEDLVTMRKCIDDATNPFIEVKEEAKKEVAKRYSEKAATIISRLKTFNDQNERYSLACIISKLMGEDISSLFVPVRKSDSEIIFTKWCCIVPDTCMNSHNYSIGCPILVDHGDVCMNSNGLTGNHMDMKMSALHIATEKEIDVFMESVKKHTIGQLKKAV